MNILFSGLWVSNEIVQAICLTLIHSIWQGLLAAFITGMIILFSKKTSSRTRYYLLTGILIFFLITSFLTFFIQIQYIHHENLNTANSSIVFSENPGTSLNGNSFFKNEKERIIGRVENFSNKNADYIVAIWFLILLFHCVRLASGVNYIHRIRYTKTLISPDEWKEKLIEFAGKLGIKEKVVLLQSAIVKMPVVIGTLKPVILIPLGLLANVSKEQVEAILLHELAHIKRKDFLVNFCQSIADALFFFNPGYIWISSLIRAEREACCDEIALSNGIDKHIYLEALISFQESRLPGNYAMAFGSKRSYLFDRARKILTRENKKLNYMEKVLLLAGIVSITAFGFIAKQNETKNNYVLATPLNKIDPSMSQKDNGSTVKLQISEKDTLPERYRVIDDRSRASIIETDYKGKKYVIRRSGNKITSLTINGESIPEKDFRKYEKVIQEIELNEEKEFVIKRDDMRNREEELKREIRENNRANRENEEAYRREMMERKLEMNREMMERNQNENQEMHQKMMAIKEQMEKLKQLQVKDKNNERLQEKQLELEKLLIGLKERQSNLLDLQDKQAMNHERMQEKMMQMDHMQREREKMAIMQRDQEKMEQYIKLGLDNGDEIHSIIEDLYNHNIITGHDPLSFSLNKNELIVNGKTQSSEIQKELKEKYIRKDGDLFNYIHEKGSTSITIHRD